MLFAWEVIVKWTTNAFCSLVCFWRKFQPRSCQHVTELAEIKTENFLSELVRSGGNYSIHPSYLIGLEEFVHELKHARELMVEHFLRVCHDLTIKYWSKDGSHVARKTLKENLHHVEKVLMICEEALNETNPVPAIVNILVKSQIYQSSSRFFYNFIFPILSPTLVRKFLERCTQLAKRQRNTVTELNFECLLADEIGRRSE